MGYGCCAGSAPRKRVMKYARLYVGPDGETHWQDLEMTMASLPGRTSHGYAWPVTEAIFIEADGPDSRLAEWHHAPARQLVVQLLGEREIETSDGDRRHFGPGDVMLVEDTTGKGHRVYETGPRRTMHIPLAD
jgi:hypothetical protein